MLNISSPALTMTDSFAVYIQQVRLTYSHYTNILNYNSIVYVHKYVARVTLNGRNQQINTYVYQQKSKTSCNNIILCTKSSLISFLLAIVSVVMTTDLSVFYSEYFQLSKICTVKY